MKSRAAATPFALWMSIFTVVPMAIVVWFAFTDETGAFTMANIAQIWQYAGTYVDSIWMGALATVICLLLAYPVALSISRKSENMQRTMVMIVMLPMWMNFLLRTYAWMTLLENNGLINQFLRWIGVIGEGASLELINTDGAVVLGMVYNFLPFMILPIFSVIDKLDKRYIEAAQDLGANKRETFRRVIFPLSLPGVLSGVTMVFIPSISTFAISKLLGGGMSFLLGDLIEMQFLGSAYNPHLGSAIALMMLVLVVVATLITNRFGDGDEGTVLM